MHRISLVALFVGCHPRLSVGYDATAHTRGPLAQLQPIARITAVTGTPAPPPPAGTNVSAGVAIGDRLFALGLRVHANNLSGSTLDPLRGPQYVSAAAALDFRFAWVRFRRVALTSVLAPTRTWLLDSTSGDASWGSGIRYSAGVEVSVSRFAVYADAFQELVVFIDGPAAGHSRRSGVTLGLAVRP